MSDPKQELRELSADLRAWLEWEGWTGAVELPADPSPVVIAAPQPATPPRTTRAPTAPSSPAPARTPPPTRAPAPQPQMRPIVATPVPTGNVAKGAEGLAQVRAELGDCQRCALAQGRKHIVYGVGNPNAELVLVGEAPGQQEDITGEPFVGKSGQLLTRMLAAIGLERDQVYICNVIKCRPPQNRDPLPQEIATCSPFLHRQIRALQPKVLMTLGRFAGVNMLGRQASMGELRRDGVGSFQGTPVVPTFHPSYLLRTPAAKRGAWEDLLRVRAMLRGE